MEEFFKGAAVAVVPVMPLVDFFFEIFEFVLCFPVFMVEFCEAFFFFVKVLLCFLVIVLV